MSKYNVGDVVKLRDDLEVGKEYGAEKLNETMNDAIGKKAEIKNCHNDRYYAKFASRYGGCWFITDEMIEGLWEECKEKQDKLKLIDVLNMIAKGELKEGSKVKVRENMYSFNDNDLKREDDEDFVITVFEENSFAVLDIEVELIEPPCVAADKTIEPTDNTKIEELDKEEMLCLTLQCAIAVLTDKLNEVIRKINKE